MNVGFVELILLILTFFGGSMGLPLGLPPGEDDPRMAKVAPEKCLLYTSWSGVGAIDAEASPTEAWMDQPGVKQLMEKLRSGFADYLLNQSNDLEQPIDQHALATLTGIAECAFHRPAALYITSAKIDPLAPQFEGALLVQLGADRDEIEKRWQQWQALFPQQQADPTRYQTQELDGRMVVRFRFDKPAPDIWISIEDDLALLATSAEQIQQARANLSTPAPQWLTAAREASSIQRVASLSYLDLRGLRGSLDDLLDEDVRFYPFWGKEFFDSIKSAQSLTSVSGLDEKGFVTRTSIRTDQELTGVFDLFDSEPLPRETWRQIPVSSTAAVGTRLETSELIEVIRGLARGQDERAALDDALAGLESFTEVPLEDELIAALGNRVTAHVNVAFPFGIDSWTVSIGIEDDMTFPGILEQITLALQKQIVLQHGEQAFETKQIDRDTYYIFHPPQQGNLWGGRGDLVWGFVDDSLVISHSEQGFLTARDGGPEEHLGKLPAIEELYEVGQAEGWGGPVAVVDVNLGEIFKGLAVFIDQFRQDGNLTIDELGIKSADIPPAKEWHHHVQPNITGLFRTPNGFHVYQRQTYPGAMPLVTFGGLTTGGIPFLVKDYLRDQPTK